ncbi:hypothetical protein HNP38_002749 [Chryseobacterium defluvii]|uniref:DUF5977 domain-containing protein n=1 Tax=Chryseobacterium defluvii TaxID=160396 RepID=A0A840KIW8_9FLAO|nr:DUF5977 domain-containing protein [Chryseobacterium defluvii]MBB4807443.1 hypothetical protein [Chryseobacterium defluvii]
MKRLLAIIFVFFLTYYNGQIETDTLSNTNSVTATIGDAPFDAQPDSNPFNFNTLNPSSINTYTGKADISIPLYDVNFEGMAIPIRLIYNSSGMLVDQYAGEAGLGWSLYSVGEITKEVNGNYEDNEGRDNWKAYLRGLPTVPSTDFPDFYSINSPNLSGRFFIDKDLNIRELEGFNTASINFVRAKTAESEILKYGYVSNKNYGCPPGPSGPFVSYFIHTLIGTCATSETPGNHYDTQTIKINKNKFTYTFSEFEHVNIRTKTKDEAFRGSNTLPEEGTSGSDMEYHNSYKLTEIKDNISKKTLQVSYIPLARFDLNFKKDRIWEKLIHRVDNGSVTNKFRTFKNFDISTREEYIRKLVSKIKTDDVEIIFNYENLREDRITKNMVLSEIPLSPTVEYTGPFWGAELINPAVKEPLLKSIFIKNNSGQIISQYTFIYDYFNSGCTDSPLCKRLKLVAVEKGFGENNINKETYRLSYYEDRNLPKITSFNKDVFGFKGDFNEASLTDSYGFPVRPYLYKYNETRNTINFSYFSPLKVPTLNPVAVSGSYDQGISGLENIRAWSLKTITYPTQGVQSFIYEPHEFFWKGTKIIGGGLRIKEIKMLDPIKNKTLITNYKYGDGQVSALPMATGEQDIAQYGPTEIKSSIPQSFNTVMSRSKGSYVVYPNSRQINPDGGYTDYRYSSYTEYPESLKYKWLMSGSYIDVDLDSYLFSKNSVNSKIFNYDYLRGNLLSQKINDKNNNLLKVSEYQYTATQYPSPVLGEQQRYPKVRYLYWPINGTYDGNFPEQTTYQNSSLIKRNNVTKKIETEYFAGNTIQKESSMTYTDRFNLPKTITITGPLINETKIYNYAFEGSDALLNANVNYEQLQLGNERKMGNEAVEKTKITFFSTNNLVVPNAKYTYNFAVNDWMKEKGFDVYDNKGNILQQSRMDKPTVIIWGYKQTKPIAVIEGATYAQVMQAFGLDPNNNISYLDLDIVKKSDLDIDDSTEDNLITVLDNFRNKPELKDFKITTHTFDPLIGVKSNTQESGIRIKYKFDGSNRVEKVLDNNEDTVKQYNYNYATTRYYNSEKSQSFTKNCGGTGIGSTHLYIVPENKYSSLVSQSDADGKAENEINSNGQNYANNIGTCTTLSCSIVKGSGINVLNYGSIVLYGSSSPSNFRVQMGYPINTSLNWNTGVIVGKIIGNCQSPNIRTSTTYFNGVWGITVNPDGNIIVRFVPGATSTVPPNNTPINLDFALPIN